MAPSRDLHLVRTARDADYSTALTLSFLCGRVSCWVYMVHVSHGSFGNKRWPQWGQGMLPGRLNLKWTIIINHSFCNIYSHLSCHVPFFLCEPYELDTAGRSVPNNGCLVCSRSHRAMPLGSWQVVAVPRWHTRSPWWYLHGSLLLAPLSKLGPSTSVHWLHAQRGYSLSPISSFSTCTL